jgi:hypothetical protein
MDRDKEDRLRRYQDAYEQAVSEDSPENRGLYRAIYREAWDRRECMLCAEPMTMPNTHQLLREDRSPAATRFIAHERCFELMAAGQGFEIVRREPSGVDSDDGALVSETVLERPHHGPRRQRITGTVPLGGSLRSPVVSTAFRPVCLPSKRSTN